MMAQVRARLDGQAKPPLRLVRGAAELALIAREPPPRANLPVAYVLPIRLSAGPNRLATLATSQRVAFRFAVQLVAGAEAQRDGQAAADAIEPVSVAVRRALVGWQPADEADMSVQGPCLYGGGRITGLDDGLLFWADEFEFPYDQRSL